MSFRVVSCRFVSFRLDQGGGNSKKKKKKKKESPYKQMMASLTLNISRILSLALKILIWDFRSSSSGRSFSRLWVACVSHKKGDVGECVESGNRASRRVDRQWGEKKIVHKQREKKKKKKGTDA